MVHEVVVVGGGIGGLTVAALLAARGVDVCLLERASRPGGVLARVESFGYAFDPGVGLYPLWEPGEIHDRVFSELPVARPEVRHQVPAYVVRLPDQTEIALTADEDEFAAALLAAFPECGDKAIKFYRESALVSQKLRRALAREPDLFTAGRLRQIQALFPDLAGAAKILRAKSQTTSEYLQGTSQRFRRFVDVQLQLLTQTSSDACSYLRAALALTIPRQGTFSIQGGAPALAERLAESIKQSGGRIRFDTPALRLAYDSSGRAVGVDLLSGETVGASRAIVSNLTVWDTYGKLIGLNRTPTEIRKHLSGLSGWGVYLLYLGMNEKAAQRLPGNQILALTDWQEEATFDPETSQFMFAATPAWDPRAPEGRRAVTVLTFTDVERWFTFHESAEELEEKDQTTLEDVWRRLHQAIPELGDDIEVVDTFTPLTCYESTRRKLGMVGAPRLPAGSMLGPGGSTSLENVFMVGDTSSEFPGIAGVSCSALALANRLTP